MHWMGQQFPSKQNKNNSNGNLLKISDWVVKCKVKQQKQECLIRSSEGDSHINSFKYTL